MLIKEKPPPDLGGGLKTNCSLAATQSIHRDSNPAAANLQDFARAVARAQDSTATVAARKSEL